MLREAIRIEERVLISHIEESLHELESLDIPENRRELIREKLETTHKETIDHNEKFQKAIIEVQESDKDDY